MHFARMPASLLMLLLMAMPGAMAEEKATQEEARGLTLKAVELIRAGGLDKARPVLEEVGPYRHGELYVNVINVAGTWLVYPPMPSGEGRSVLEVKDATGKYIAQEIIKIARDEGEGWVEYRWLNPETKQVGPKVSYVKRVPETDLIVYVGVYK